MGRPVGSQNKKGKDSQKELKKATTESIANAQELDDLLLLKETRETNPFALSLMKRTPLWRGIAERLNHQCETDTRDDRNCRKRVKLLMSKYRATKPPTGTGYEDPTEAQVILQFLVDEEDRTDSYKEEDLKKQSANEASAVEVRRLALERVKNRKDREMETPSNVDEDYAGEFVKRSTSVRAIQNKPKSPIKPGYQRPKPVDHMASYLDSKQVQQEKQLEVKIEMHKRDLDDHREERDDRKEDRLLRMEELKLQRKKLELDGKRLENEAKSQASMWEASSALLTKKVEKQ